MDEDAHSTRAGLIGSRADDVEGHHRKRFTPRAAGTLPVNGFGEGGLPWWSQPNAWMWTSMMGGRRVIDDG
jgi:hypothetical protein